MASFGERCIFCAQDLDLPKDGWSFKDPACFDICDSCLIPFKEDSFCHKYHKHEHGWKQCDNCRKEIHWDCIMALHTFSWNEAHGITCKECLLNENLMASTISVPPSIPNPVDPSLLKHTSSSSENFTVEDILMDPEAIAFSNNVPLNLGNSSIEEISQPSHLPNTGLTYLFEKRLCETDCSMKAGRLVLPKRYVERFLPMPPGKQVVPIVVKDTEGRTWNLTLRWWAHKNGRKYAIDSIRVCLRRMNWKVGDTMKFYRETPGGGLVMEHVRTHSSNSSS